MSDFVAERAGEVVGWIQVTVHEELDEIGEQGAWIQSLAVLPHLRGQGIGGKLVERAQAQAIQAGDRVIACQPLDQDSAAFFRGQGFADNTMQEHEPFWSKRMT
ncbi:hypothetical protein ASC58_12245 [Phycicoccus sp. Root101]|nr:hypothetical protein ASC58_12245 [Phycicoccus sp. Root101]